MEKAVNKKVKRLLIIIVSIIMLPFLAFGALLLFVPISRPNEAVRDHVLRNIPIGTSWDSAITIMNKKHWQIERADLDRGLRINDKAGYAEFANAEEMLNDSEDSSIRIVGSKAMYVELGEFYAPFNTAVYAYMAFDESNELVEVSIRRDIDAI